MFDFKKQLAMGNKYEIAFAELYRAQGETSLLIKSENRAWDFETVEGKRLELKTDSYDMKKTKNFFMERYSDLYKKTPGGPWRAAQDGVDIFVYWFPKNNVWFEFHNVPALKEALDKITEGMFIMKIPNQAWTTGGYKIPRDLLVHHFRRCEHV